MRFLVLIGMISLPLLLSAHPVHGHKAHSIDHMYDEDGGLPASWSYGDITFTNKRAPVALLSEEEKYMIAGASSSELRAVGLLPWETVIFIAVDRFYEKYGYVPSVLTPDVIRSIPGKERLAEKELEEYRNPLTDEWPRLDAKTPSPGNLYVKHLSKDEMQHFAEKAINWELEWFGHKKYMGEEKGYVAADLSSEVYYFRMYGAHGILCENFQYRMTRFD
jgi:hypothetical protein